MTIDPMLAKLERELPLGDYVYEPKWDGFRCLAYRTRDDLDLRSRNDRPLARYFPEVVEALTQIEPDSFALDGELVGVDHDFQALMGRLHPAATRVAELARTAPTRFVVFDLLALGGENLLEAPFHERRARLEALAVDANRKSAQSSLVVDVNNETALSITPATADADAARQWLDAPVPAIDGVIAKRRDQRYTPGARSMVKVKRARTLDVVVAGMRLLAEPLRVASLLLGLYDDAGALQHIGVVANLGKRRGVEVLEQLRSDVVPLAGHPWEQGFLVGGGALARLRGAAARWTPEMPQDWVPLSARRVAEVAYDRADDGRLRYPARLLRWRPDRDARSCTFDQLG